MYRRSMIYSSPLAKSKGTEPNGRIHRYGASIFRDIIVIISESIKDEKQKMSYQHWNSLLLQHW